MLITYADSLGRNLRELDGVLAEHFTGAVGGVHLLPFFPSSADRGFAPTRYDQVDSALGTWEDVDALGERYYLMFDFMINHLSRQSEPYRDMVLRGKASPYWSLFLHYAEFWPGGEPSAAQLEQVYKRKPRAPYLEQRMQDGSTEKLWCTFSEEQVDLDVQAPVTQAFIRDTIRALAARRMSVLRLDAFAYAVKKVNTNCFFVEPEIWDLLSQVQRTADEFGVVLLPEIHVIYKASALMSQLSILENVFYANLSTFVFQKQTYREMLLDAMEEFHIPVAPDTPISRLTHAQAIWIELLKAYFMKRRILVLADVSYYLTGVEMEEIFLMIDKLKARGYAIILIDSARAFLMKHGLLGAINQYLCHRITSSLL